MVAALEFSEGSSGFGFLALLAPLTRWPGPLNPFLLTPIQSHHFYWVLLVADLSALVPFDPSSGSAGVLLDPLPTAHCLPVEYSRPGISSARD